LDAVVAASFTARLRGLAGRDRGELVPMLLPRCRSIHTFGMRAPIDVVWLDLAGEDGVVGEIIRNLRPRRVARAPCGCNSVLELPPDSADRLGLRIGNRVLVRAALALPAAAR
jgi:uncharacterized protein